MKKLNSALVTASLLSAACLVQADTEISGNVTLTSDYVWRGISQTQNNGAIQGGIDYAHESGFYAGAWGSNVDFDNDASLELDLYAGYSRELSDGITIDVGVLKYAYPDTSDLNFTEGYVSVSAAGFTLGHHSSGSLWADESTSYTYLSYETEIGGIGLSASIGQYDIKDMVFLTEEEYEDFSLAVSKSYWGVDWALTYTDTSLDDDECAAFAGDEDYCDAILAVSVSKSL
jgi:uncharacterized protein (TIGR02001 family)